MSSKAMPPPPRIVTRRPCRDRGSTGLQCGRPCLPYDTAEARQYQHERVFADLPGERPLGAGEDHRAVEVAGGRELLHSRPGELHPLDPGMVVQGQPELFRLAGDEPDEAVGLGQGDVGAAAPGHGLFDLGGQMVEVGGVGAGRKPFVLPRTGLSRCGLP